MMEWFKVLGNLFTRLGRWLISFKLIGRFYNFYSPAARAERAENNADNNASKIELATQLLLACTSAVDQANDMTMNLIRTVLAGKIAISSDLNLLAESVRAVNQPHLDGGAAAGCWDRESGERLPLFTMLSSLLPIADESMEYRAGWNRGVEGLQLCQQKLMTVSLKLSSVTQFTCCDEGAQRSLGYIESEFDNMAGILMNMGLFFHKRDITYASSRAELAARAVLVANSLGSAVADFRVRVRDVVPYDHQLPRSLSALSNDLPVACQQIMQCGDVLSGIIGAFGPYGEALRRGDIDGYDGISDGHRRWCREFLPMLERRAECYFALEARCVSGLLNHIERVDGILRQYVMLTAEEPSPNNIIEGAGAEALNIGRGLLA